MTKAEFDDWADGFEEGEDDQPIVYPQFQEAIIGIVERFGMSPVVLYDRDKVIQILMRDLECDEEGAEEWFGFNTIGGWVGTGTPAFAQLIKENIAS